MMDNGASGYVLKNATQEELMEAIEIVASGKIYLSDEVASVLRKDNNETMPVIPRQEKELLDLVAEGMTNNEIAKQLFTGITTVDTHRKKLLTKFNAKNTASLIRIAAHLKII